MAIAINIEDLLNKRKIEYNRIEFKKGWNPDKIYRTICAFANDFDNIGGGYIVVGIEEEERTGIAKRPVTGLPIEGLNDIQKDMVGYNSKIEPCYMHRIDVQEIDGRSVLVMITIESKKISILSYAGPDRSISLDAIHKAEHLKSRRYRNRRLGDYLKELQLSEGRATGIPTIQDELRKNGSEPAKIETDEDRTYFLIEIPCREEFENANEPLNEAINEPLSEKEMLILREISNRQPINRKLLAQFTGILESTITRIISRLSTDPFVLVERQGAKKDGGYILTEKGSAFLMRKHHINENIQQQHKSHSE